MSEKNSSNVAVQYCPRCPYVELKPLAASTIDIDFFECPSCQRSYARKLGGSLVYRWLHPVSLPLYLVLFDKEPLLKAEHVAKHLSRNRSKKELATITNEIELELRQPTQNVREILDNVASEEKCREFLEAFVAQMRTRLRKHTLMDWLYGRNH